MKNFLSTLLRWQSKDVFCVVDIGTHKVTCLIGQRRNHKIHILGHAYQNCQGVERGIITDMNKAQRTIHKVIGKAQDIARMHISAVIVNISASAASSHYVSARTRFSNTELSDQDYQRLTKHALQQYNKPGHGVLHAFIQGWKVDGQQGVRDPRGLYGNELEMQLQFITVPLGLLRNISYCFERAGLHVLDMIATPYAAGVGVLSEAELESGAIVVDIGAGLTHIAVFRDGGMLFSDVLESGGEALTKMLSRTLVTPFSQAEHIKITQGSTLENAKNDNVMVECLALDGHEEPHYESLSFANTAIRKHMEGLFAAINKRLADANLLDYAGRLVVLTGGGSMLGGIEELASFSFSKRVRVGRPHGLYYAPEIMNGPECAVVCGLLKQVFMLQYDIVTGPPELTEISQREHRRRQRGLRAKLRHIWVWLRTHF